MVDILPLPLPWYVVGPLLGLTVAGFYAVTNKHLGISGAYVQAVDFARGRPVETWRLWLLGGTFAGAAIVAILGGYPQAGLGYGALGEYFSLPALVAVLFVGGLLIGYGARWAGACTSGHGLTGCATRSRGSMVAVCSLLRDRRDRDAADPRPDRRRAVNRLHVACALFGLAFGAVFAAAGFNQYDVIHRMLLLEDAGGFLTMASAVGTAMVLLWWLERRRWHTALGGEIALRRWEVERKHLWGGLVFGTGWAVTGACPGTASTALGAGSVMGIVLVAGMIAGIALRDFTVERPTRTPVTHPGPTAPAR